MKLRNGLRCLSLFLSLCLGASSAMAETRLEFDIWMQKIDRHSQTILGHLRHQDGPAALADARELERLYRLMEQFYERLDDADDAVIASYDGRERAAAAATAVGKGDFNGAFESAVGIAKDCRNCHDRFKPIKSSL